MIEVVADSTIEGLLKDTGLKTQVDRKATGLDQVLSEPAISPADAESLNRLLSESAFACQVGLGFRSQAPAVVVGRPGENVKDASALFILQLAVAIEVGQGDAGTAGKLIQDLEEGFLLVELQKVDDIASSATAEAVEILAAGLDGEAWGSVLVERAKGNVSTIQ
jgi:hypothetical protein